MSKLRYARAQRGWSQTQAIHALARVAAADGRVLPGVDSMRIMLSRWENGHVRPDAAYRRYLRVAYQATDDELGLVEVPDGVGLDSGVGLPTVTPELLARFDHVFDAIARADNELGAKAVLAAAEADARVLLHLAAQDCGPLRSDVVAMASRFSELCGWLRQDAGDVECAQRWSDRALDCATELGDDEQVAYVLMRKSNIASDAGQSARALALAQAALRRERSLTPQYRAATLRQLAWGHALAGERQECLTALERAREAVGGTPKVDGRAAYVVPAYIGSEAGRCLVALGASDKAAPVLRQGP